MKFVLLKAILRKEIEAHEKRIEDEKRSLGISVLESASVTKSCSIDMLSLNKQQSTGLSQE